MLRKLVLGVAVVALSASTAAAQASAGMFTVGPRVGYVRYAEQTAIQESAVLGLDGLYYISNNFGIGFTLDVARPQTDSSFFPAEMSFGDTTFTFGVKQPLTIAQFGIQAEITTGGTLAPFLRGSIGAYRVTLDPQVARGSTNFVELGFSFGGGINFATSPGTAVRIEVRDYVFTDFDRSVLNPVDPAFAPTRFPEVLPAQEPFFGTAHNIQISLAFSFTPGGQ